MANHASSEKRNRQTITRTLRNRSVKTRVRNLVKKVREAVGRNDKTAATEALAKAVSALDGAVTKGVLHRSTASRSVSRLTIAVQKVA